MLKTLFSSFALVLLTACAIGQEVSPEDTATAVINGPETGLSGWNEVIITTADPEAWDAFLTRDAGWEKRSTSPMDTGLTAYWGMPEGVTGTETLYANIGATSGFIRLIELQGVEQEMIRVDDRPWDAGGYFDINVRVLGLRDLRETMIANGWQGDSEPIQYTFGPFEVIEWIARGPDGVRIAFIERLKPTLEGWPNLKVMSRSFNATQTVKDMDAALVFFRDVLGMKTYLEHKGASSKPGPNVLGLPFEAAAEVDRIVYILHPDGVNEGSMELLAFDGATGRDISERAKPYNLGVSVLRYPVADLDATMTAIAQRGGEFISDVHTLEIAPYGRVKTAAMVAPDGGRIEIYQPITD